MNLMVPDEGNSGIPCHHHLPVTEFHDRSGGVPEAAVFIIINVLGSIRLHFDQALVIRADPEMVL